MLFYFMEIVSNCTAIFFVTGVWENQYIEKLLIDGKKRVRDYNVTRKLLCFFRHQNSDLEQTLETIVFYLHY